MGEYKAFLTIIDERNGEIVGELRNIEIEDDAFTEEELERIEEFVSVTICSYEEDVYGI